ncbi:hypothetical protein HK100_012090 [Physocladia obscura]|uniref:Uncharacterized protein n=1 Tax=Physocladia obscura TaxID=109957 RepID=A0AAD5T2V2_9FUNG|nr:hypothetical protein HK100_012090 [Physocladia obscura]
MMDADPSLIYSIDLSDSALAAATGSSDGLFWGVNWQFVDCSTTMATAPSTTTADLVPPQSSAAIITAPVPVAAAPVDSQPTTAAVTVDIAASVPEPSAASDNVLPVFLNNNLAAVTSRAPPRFRRFYSAVILVTLQFF